MTAAEILFQVGMALWLFVQVGFVVRYHLKRPWWTTPVGRALMVKSAALTAFITAIELNWHVIDLPDFVWAGFAFLMFGAVARQWWVMEHADRYMQS